jgi:hypothetical protein
MSATTNNDNYTPVLSEVDVTPEILQIAESINDGWFSDSPIDWEDFLDRLDGAPLDDGSTIDIGIGMDLWTPANLKIKSHLRAYRRK